MIKNEGNICYSILTPFKLILFYTVNPRAFQQIPLPETIAGEEEVFRMWKNSFRKTPTPLPRILALAEVL